LTLFIAQFTSSDFLPITIIGCNFQFTLSWFLFIHYIIVRYSSPEKLVNAKAEGINLVKERKKLLDF